MNNVNDSTILNDSMSTIMEKTPDLIELHTDGAYGSPDNDDDLKKSGVTNIQRRGVIELTEAWCD